VTLIVRTRTNTASLNPNGAEDEAARFSRIENEVLILTEEGTAFDARFRRMK
jgi:hypothetical protein